MTTEVDDIAMCMACQEMELYYAYLDAIEAEKRKAEPWECEVTVIAPADAAAAPRDTAIPAAPKPAAPKPAASHPATAARPGFACDETE